MNKTTQMWLGVAVLGVAGYLLWKKSQEKKSFANLISSGPGGVGQLRCNNNSDCIDPKMPVCAGASANRRGYCISRQIGNVTTATF